MSAPARSRATHAVVTGSLLLAALLAGGASRADEPKVIVLTIRDHRFTPSELRVPAGVPVILDVRNEDASAEELESRALKIEKVIPGNAAGKVRIRALEKGKYAFVGEYHEATASGVLIAE